MVGGMVLNNRIYEYVGYENWALESGYEEDDEGNFFEVYQYYIITYQGARVLSDYTDEIVYYNDELDMYIWGITHFGTAWDYVLTDVELI